jgi:hypothetical protein
VHWVKAERVLCAPDRRLHLSVFRTPNPRKKITIAATALGTVAAAAGAISVWSAGAAAQPAGSARQPHSLSQAAPHVAVADGTQILVSRHEGAELDAFSAVLAHKPASSVIGKPSSAKAPKKKHAKARPLTAKQIARRMLRSFRWRGWQFKYLNLLWSRESGWNVFAQNPDSGAYGIPQAVPGSKMASAGPNWESSARTQIRWGLGYIQAMYGSPLGAWRHELATGWY